MTEQKKYVIPATPQQPKRKEPRSIIIYSAPKVGKTAISAKLPDSLIVELERGGADAIEARVIEINSPKDFSPLMEQLKSDSSIKYIVIDTTTKLDEWSELVGTYAFHKKPQGKRWNVIDNKRINHKHPSFETIHAMGEGFGYRYSREVMVNWFKETIATDKTIIFLTHIKDKFIETKSGDIVESIDLNLTGKVKSIYSANVDAIAHLKRTGNKSYLVFENMGGTVSGSRYAYLKGSILIGESDDNGVLTTHWDKIFPSLKDA